MTKIVDVVGNDVDIRITSHTKAQVDASRPLQDELQSYVNDEWQKNNNAVIACHDKNGLQIGSKPFPHT